MRLSTEEFRRLGYRAVDIAAGYLNEVSEGPVFQRMPEAARQTLLDMPLPEEPVEGGELLSLFEEHILPHPMGNGHKRFFGWVNSPPAMMAVITETLAAAMNPSCAGGDHAAIYLEHCVVRWLMELLEFPAEGSAGLLVSGGSAATLTALAAARHRAFARLGIDVRKAGVAASKLRLYASTQVHACTQKSVELLGLGSDCIRWIETGPGFRFSLDALTRAIEEDRHDGWHPFCIVASAGSVQTGAIDPLAELAAIAEKENLWFHIDGAYGAVGILDPAVKPLFAGMEQADSIALDPHKWLSTPVECGCLLLRDKQLLRDAFSLIPPYLRTETGKGIGNLPWFSEFGFQQTRGFRALKLWVTLAHAGASGLRNHVARSNQLARLLERKIEARPGLELCAQSHLSIVCFRCVPEDLADDPPALDAINKAIMEQVQSEGAAFLTNTVLAGRFTLRACILHYDTSEEDLDIMLAAVERAARRSK